MKNWKKSLWKSRFANATLQKEQYQSGKEDATFANATLHRRRNSFHSRGPIRRKRISHYSRSTTGIEDAEHLLPRSKKLLYDRTNSKIADKKHDEDNEIYRIIAAKMEHEEIYNPRRLHNYIRNSALLQYSYVTSILCRVNNRGLRSDTTSGTSPRDRPD